MSSSITGFLGWLEQTAWASGIRQSLWLYPALEIVHITGIVILVGAAFMFDLRLLGFSKTLPVIGLSRHLLPWSRRGLLLVVPSGILLFMTNAQTLGADPVFWLKILLLLVAGLNVLVFHKVIFENKVTDTLAGVPLSAKISASVSIMVWIAIIACGRLLAY